MHKDKIIQVTYQNDGWLYERVYADGKEHAGNLDILYKFEDGHYETVFDKYFIFLGDDLKKKTGVVGWAIRQHSDEPFEWHSN